MYLFQQIHRWMTVADSEGLTLNHLRRPSQFALNNWHLRTIENLRFKNGKCLFAAVVAVIITVIVFMVLKEWTITTRSLWCNRWKCFHARVNFDILSYFGFGNMLFSPTGGKKIAQKKHFGVYLGSDFFSGKDSCKSSVWICAYWRGSVEPLWTLVLWSSIYVTLQSVQPIKGDSCMLITTKCYIKSL